MSTKKKKRKKKEKKKKKKKREPAKYWTSGDHPDYRIIKVGQNTEKRPGDLRRLAITQTPAKNHEQNLEINNNNKKKKRICKIVDFAVPADHRINLKESEKKDKYLDLARELKKLRNIKVTIVPIVTGALGTITKGLLKGLEDLGVGGRAETIQTTALLRTARILRRVLET